MSQRVRFECPRDYEAVNVKEASHLMEGDDDLMDQEMWLLRLPSQFDVESLNGKEIDISNWSNNQFKTTKDVTYTCATSLPDEISGMSVVLPNNRGKGLTAVAKPLSGLCCFFRDITVPNPTLPPSKKIKLEVPDGLKARFVPFGSGSPLTMKGQQKKNAQKHDKRPKANKEKLHHSKKRKRHSSDSDSPQKHSKKKQRTDKN